MFAGWRAGAARASELRTLLAHAAGARAARYTSAAFAAWRAFLMHRVAKRMKALSALLHAERAVTHRTLRAWQDRLLVWRAK